MQIEPEVRWFSRLSPEDVDELTLEIKHMVRKSRTPKVVCLKANVPTYSGSTAALQTSERVRRKGWCDKCDTCSSTSTRQFLEQVA
jgi:hypothetical protein